MTVSSRDIIQRKHLLAPVEHLRSRPRLSDTVTLDLTDWDLILQTGSNALLQGPPLALKQAVSALEGYLRAPQCRVSPARWSLASGATGTLIIEHVDACTIEQQHELLGWFSGAAGSVQVIATTEKMLFNLVERGDFLIALYYRLNTIHVTFDTAH